MEVGATLPSAARELPNLPKIQFSCNPNPVGVDEVRP